MTISNSKQDKEKIELSQLPKQTVHRRFFSYPILLFYSFLLAAIAYTSFHIPPHTPHVLTVITLSSLHSKNISQKLKKLTGDVVVLTNRKDIEENRMNNWEFSGNIKFIDNSNNKPFENVQYPWNIVELDQKYHYIFLLNENDSTDSLDVLVDAMNQLVMDSYIIPYDIIFADYKDRVVDNIELLASADLVTLPKSLLMTARVFLKLKYSPSNASTNMTIPTDMTATATGNDILDMWLLFTAKSLRSYHLRLPLLQGTPKIARLDDSFRSILMSITEGSMTNVPNLKQLDHPTISIIIPYFNAHNWLVETLDSLHAQTFQDIEVIIVDDVSTDGISTTFLNHLVPSGTSSPYPKFMYRHSLPVSIVRHIKNFGLSASRNTGAFFAKGEYIAFIDPDDLIVPTALEKLLLMAQISLWKQYQSVNGNIIGYVYPGFLNFKDGQILSHKLWKFDRDQLLCGNHLVSFALIPRAFFLATGGMCVTKIDYFEDYDYWLRLMALGYVGFGFPEPLFHYRRHSHGQSTKFNKIGKLEWMQEIIDANPLLYSVERDELAFDKQSLEDSEWIAENMPCYQSVDENKILERMRHSSIDEFLLRNTDYLKNRPPQSVFSAIQSISHHISSLYSFLVKKNTQTTHILVFIPWFQTGGADLYDINILSALSCTDQYSFTIITEIAIAPSTYIQGQFESLSHADIFALPPFISAARELGCAYNNLECHERVKLEAERFIIDYLVSSRNTKIMYIRNSLSGYRAAQRWHKQVQAIDIHHLAMPDEESWWSRGELYRSFIANRIVSDSNLKQLKDETTFFIPPPIPIPIVKDEKYTESKWITLAFIGRLEVQKDPLLWMRISVDCAKENANILLLIIGDGSLKLSMAQIAKDAKISHRTLFAGEVEHPVVSDMLKHGLMMDENSRRIHIASANTNGRVVFLSTSVFEGLPTVFLECWSLGIPVMSLYKSPTVSNLFSEINDNALGSLCEEWNVRQKILDMALQMSIKKRRVLPNDNFSKKYSKVSFNQHTQQIFSNIH